MAFTDKLKGLVGKKISSFDAVDFGSGGDIPDWFTGVKTITEVTDDAITICSTLEEETEKRSVTFFFNPNFVTFFSVED